MSDGTQITRVPGGGIVGVGDSEGSGDTGPDADDSDGDGDAESEPEPEETESAAEPAGTDAVETVETDRWRTGLVVALTAGAAGVFLGNTAVLLSAVVGLTYAGYASLSAPPSPALVVERTVEPRSPSPGETLTVTVSVENVGAAPVADLRVADEPPGELSVVDGDTRAASTLGGGESVTLEYEVRARRGAVEFGDVTTVARSANGAAAHRSVHEVDDRVVCRAPFEALELAAQTGVGAGRVETDTGGEGVEFFSTREFHPADPMSRVDWNRYAATGELTTVTYRESKSATVVFVVDGRHPVRRRAGEPSAVDLCGYATVRVADALLGAQDSVGAVALAGSDSSLDARGYLRPGTGEEQALRVRTLLQTALGVETGDGGVAGTRSFAAETEMAAADDSADNASALPGGLTTGGNDWVDRLPDGAQVVFATPLLDETAADLARQLAAREHVTTVLSPDVTSGETAGGAVERVRRDGRLGSLRGVSRIRVVDWSPDEPLQAAVDRAKAGWDR